MGKYKKDHNLNKETSYKCYHYYNEQGPQEKSSQMLLGFTEAKISFLAGQK